MNIFNKKTQVHVIGAGGIGLSAAARLLKHEGLTVTGSDMQKSETTDELALGGIPVTIGQDPSALRHNSVQASSGQGAAGLPEGTDLVLYSGAVPEDNPERRAAAESDIPQMSYFEFIGEYSKGKRTIAVSGTNGKSTVTAMLGMMLVEAGLDPTVIVGSKVPSFPGKNLRIGESDLFVVEACEHEANILKLYPQMIVLTNIEEDHLDFYRDLEHIRDTFQEYVDRLPPDGLLVLNADDPASSGGIGSDAPVVTYSVKCPADYAVREVTVGGGKQEFDIMYGAGQQKRIRCSLRQPGLYNVYNALAAVAAATELGAAPEAVSRALGAFGGIWRRFEHVGEWRGATVISDYGHHPTAIREVLAGTREFYPGRRIVLAFQPHHHNRTKKLFSEFVASFDGADVLVLAEIYDVAGRESSGDPDISSGDLARAVRDRDSERGSSRETVYAPSLDAVIPELSSIVRGHDILILMGAGDIYLLADKLKQAEGSAAEKKGL